ncbi:hypothetical protein ASD50_19575 [Mesorhizobium sp. Root552]|uniref:UDP-2,4-diacetamido-2,4, 6-trideoxy-beta-L-altropyranose hydrolase n=1 Tax=Mesorhizobium sp. Root552 TaxID=1736555 RepID=UPI0006F57FCF|nr:UDP-2,4-diacetamido-2,4,6-trideoxy-beta-L-altropyranose hydrolase [Mesorhizobium sp. Root552]KQZ28523.1 hypothetical protein ASD50_19575 [Mesorhizobium sp. Root552]
MPADSIRVAFRADASLAIGTGHVMRCLTFAEALQKRGADILFVCREHRAHLCDLIVDRGFSLFRLPAPRPEWTPGEDGPAHALWLGTDWQNDAEETARTIGDFHPDWLVVDHYGLDARWQSALRRCADKIMVIDDLADRPHDCDILLDQNLVARRDVRYVGKVPPHCTLLLGPRYALLQPDYVHLRRRATVREGPLRRLLVSFGGVDRAGLTQKTIEALLKLRRPDIAADIVLSSASPQFTEVERLVAGHTELRLCDRVPSLAPLMLAADLAIGAGGATSWERLCLGLPSVVISLAKNQHPISSELARRGLARWLGHWDAVDGTVIHDALASLAETGLDPTWSKKCLNVVDGYGVERVFAVLIARADMPIAVRHAELADEALVLEWVNDAATRLNAFSAKPIAAKEHHAWFRMRVRDSERCVFYIAEIASGIPLGQVRFDKRGKEWEISYAVAPIFRGRGMGWAMLAAAIERLRQEKGHVVLVAQVKPQNTASRRIFEKLGFLVRSSEPDRYVYELAF